MKREQVQNKIIEILSSTLNERFSLSDVKEDDKVAEILNINSIEAIEIIVRVENEFDIEIDDEDLSINFLQSINYVTDYVMKKLGTEN